MTIGTKRQECSKIIIGVPDRDNFRIVSRGPQMSEAEYQRMLG
jgi:lipocalin